MKNYYIHTGHNLDGPYTAQEVKEHALSVYHSIWHQTSSGLTTVDDVAELRFLRNEPPADSITYKGILPIMCHQQTLKENSKVVSMVKRVCAALFY